MATTTGRELLVRSSSAALLDDNESPKRPRCTTACETCRRRKERCDGHQPCAQCRRRGVSASCHFVHRPGPESVTETSRSRKAAAASCGNKRNSVRGATVSSTSTRASMATGVPAPADHGPVASFLDDSAQHGQAHALAAATSPVGESTRMIQDHNGRFMFIGDSANLSFLQVIRRMVGQSLGSCSFVDDPLRYIMVEASPSSNGMAGPKCTLSPRVMAPPRPDLTLLDAERLVERYSLASSCVVDLFDEADIVRELPSWLSSGPGSSIPSPLMYLILAIGAQTSIEDRDALAASLFTQGRDLAAQRFLDDASIFTVQAYCLVSFYLLNAARRNAAFMYLGIAVRAAYALGLHRREIAAAFAPEERLSRERAWKVLRILDLLMSASLGRPPSTAETRDTEAQDSDYSASTDLCHIFEKILTDIYSRRMVTTEALSNIGAHHRRWAKRFYDGLGADHIQPHEALQGAAVPNIGLLHVKEAYYWTIILLTRPFLTDSVGEHIKRSMAASRLSSKASSPEPCTASDSNKTLIYACVDSAIRTIDLLTVIKGVDAVPKRLPFVVNSLFVAALVVGLSVFGDLWQMYSLEPRLAVARELLSQFSHDAIAQRNANIVEYLREACRSYIQRRTSQLMDDQSMEVGSMFGQIHLERSRAPTRQHSPRRSATSNIAGGTSAAREDLPSEADDGHGSVANDLGYLFDGPTDFASLPYPIMSPRTVWFDSFETNTPLFSTINHADNFLYAS